jgi:hypothetical protein
MFVNIFGFLGTEKLSNYRLPVPGVKAPIGTNLKETNSNLNPHLRSINHNSSN